MRAIKTLDDYLGFVSRHMFRHKLFDWPQCKIIVDVALGDLEPARDVELSLIEAIEQQALPKLRAIQTLDDYLAFVSRHMFRHQLFDWPQCKIIVDVALGDLDAARSICKEHFPRWSVDQPHYDEDDGRKTVVFANSARLAETTGRGSRGSCMVEEHTVKHFKIEHLWAPTPFPLEQSA